MKKALRLPWLKLWHEARSDLKLRSLTSEQFRVWFNLLCYSSEQPVRGTIVADDITLLALEVSDGNIPLLEETLSRLSSLRVTTVTKTSRASRTVTDRHENSVTIVTQLRDAERDGFVTVRFVNFEKRNEDVTIEGPMTASQRARKYRERKKLEKGISATVTDRHGNVTETSHASTDSIVTRRHEISSRTRGEGEGEEEAAPIRAGAHAREAGPDPGAAAPPPSSAPPTGTPTAPAPPPAPAPGPTTPAAPPPPAVPPYPDERGPLDIHTGPHELTRAEAEAIWGLLWRTWPDAPRLANGWYEHQRWFPADRWRAAIREAHRRGETPGSVKFLERLAGDPKVGAGEAGPPPVHANGRRPAAAPVYFTAPPGHEKRPRRSDGPPPPLLPPRAPDARPDPGPKGLDP